MAKKTRPGAEAKAAKPKAQPGKGGKRSGPSPVAKVRKNGRHFIPPNPPRDPAKWAETPKSQIRRPTHMLLLGPNFKRRMVPYS